MLNHPTQSRRRRGFSLTEMLVVLGIVVVLVSMLIPALKSARRAARTTQCQSNFHQIGLALHAYLADQVYFPSGESPAYGAPAPGPDDASNGGYSPHALLLPYLQGTGISSILRRDLPWNDAANAEAVAKEIAFLKCPSDPAKRFEPLARTSYRASGGVKFLWAPPGEDAVSWKREGVFTPGSDIELEDVRDGASVTAAFSEHAIGDWTNVRLTRESDYYEIAGSETADGIREQLAAINPKDRQGNVFSKGGAPFLVRGDTTSHYTHDALPGELSGKFKDSGTFITTASSFHGKGANMLLCDGSARWVKQDIDPVTWRALGTFHGEDQVNPY